MCRLSSKAATGGRLNAFGALGGQGTRPLGNAAPTVTGVTPADGATGVRRARNVTATFFEEMDPATSNGSTVTLKNIKTGATVRGDSSCKTVTPDPNSSLAGRTKHTVTIKGSSGGAGDAAGAPLAADKVWSFTTGKK